MKEIKHMESPLDRLAKLNQFVLATVDGPNRSLQHDCVLLNVITGAFVTQCTDSISNGLFKPRTHIVKEAINIVWQEGSSDTRCHSFHLSGESLAKYEAAMVAQSKSLETHPEDK